MRTKKIIPIILIAFLAISMFACFIPSASAQLTITSVSAYCDEDASAETVEVFLADDYTFLVNVSQGNTAVDIYMTDYDDHYLKVDAYDVSGHAFKHWFVNGASYYYDPIFPINAYTAPSTIVAVYDTNGTSPLTTSTIGTYNYTIAGQIDERTGLAMFNKTINVKVVFNDDVTPDVILPVNGSARLFYNTSRPEYFVFYNSPIALSGIGDHQYWLTSRDDGGTMYAFNVTYGNFLPYTIQFNDYSGTLDNHPYVSVQKLINGTWITTQKLKIDTLHKVVVSALYGDTYQVLLGNGDSYVYGNIVFEDTNPITLTTTPFNFPDTVEIGYKYIKMYAYIDNSTFTFRYQYSNFTTDSSTCTLYVYYASNSSLAFTSSNSAYDPITASFLWTYTQAVSNVTTYLVNAIAVTDSFETTSYAQTVVATPEGVLNPFDLSFLGDLPFDAGYLIPIVILLMVAGIFSYVNCDIGVFVFIGVAVLFSVLGWIPLNTNLIVVIVVFAVINLIVRKVK